MQECYTHKHTHARTHTYVHNRLYRYIHMCAHVCVRAQGHSNVVLPCGPSFDIYSLIIILGYSFQNLCIEWKIQCIEWKIQRAEKR